MSGNTLGYHFAADNLAHYLNGTGILIVVSRKKLRSFKKIRDAEKVIQQWFETDSFSNTYKKNKSKAKDGKLKFFIDDYWDRLVSYTGVVFSNEELFFASGDSTLKARGYIDVVVVNNKVDLKGYVIFRWKDRYDFHDGLGVFIPNYGYIPDSAMKKLATQGTAQEYDLICMWKKNVKATFMLGTKSTWNWGPAL